MIMYIVDYLFVFPLVQEMLKFVKKRRSHSPKNVNYRML